MKVYVVTADPTLRDHTRVVAVCSSMAEVVRRYGISWRERFDVYETNVDGNVVDHVGRFSQPQ